MTKTVNALNMPTTVLTHLKNVGSISRMEATGLYKIRHLPGEIFRLRALGFKIETVFNRDTTGQRYARYSLVAS